MKTATTALALVLAASFAGSAIAAEPVGKTREQVRAELIQAQRDGTIVADLDTGAKARELNPASYPKQEVTLKTLEQVRAELLAAQRSGDILVDFDNMLTARQVNHVADNSAQQARSRDDVRQELREAVQNGDIIVDFQNMKTARQLRG